MNKLKKYTCLAAALAVGFAAFSCDDDDEVAVTETPTVTTVPEGNVMALVTTVYRTRDLTIDTVEFSTKDNMAPTNIYLDPSTLYQEIDGFGVGITGSTCYNLLMMTSEDRAEFLKETFDPDQFGFSYVRVSIGCSDFSMSDYTCCDTEGIENFALTDEEYDLVIPILQEILAINPDLKIMGSPWTAPVWMKVSGLDSLEPYTDFAGGYLNPAYYDDYATYFVKWIQAFKAEGIDIYSITPQNEPLSTSNSSAMYMGWEQQRDFIAGYLGPQFVANGITTKIYVYDHNYDYEEISSELNYPTNIYADADASQYVAGAAFHNYGGDASELLNVQAAYPGKELVFSEASIGTWNDGRDLTERLMDDMEEIALTTVQNYCRGVIVWNLMLDSDGSPYLEGGCSTCYGAVDISNTDYKTITRNSHYYIIAHMASVIKPDAVRIGTTGYTDDNFTYAAFENTDGTYAFVIVNGYDDTQRITVTSDDKHFAYDLPGYSVTSFRWEK